MTHCTICGARVPPGQWFRCLSRRGRLTYPLRNGGAWREQPVSWLCQRCEADARHHRLMQEGGDWPSPEAFNASR